MKEKISDDPVFLNRLFFTCLAVSAFAIFSSFFQEYVLKISLCRLCLLQRLPYFSIISFSVLGFFLQSKNIFINFVIACFLASFVLSLYHTLVQFEVLSDPCYVPKINSMESFSTMIFEQKIPCSKIQISILGLPISVYNAMLSLVFFVWLFRKRTDTRLIRNVVRDVF